MARRLKIGVKLTAGFLCHLAMAVLFPTMAIADMTIRDYKSQRPTLKDQQFRSHLSGLGDGIMIANTALRIRKQPLLFCDPEHSTIRVEKYFEILEQEIKRDRVPANEESIFKIETLLLWGLQRTFPCK